MEIKLMYRNLEFGFPKSEKKLKFAQRNILVICFYLSSIFVASLCKQALSVNK